MPFEFETTDGSSLLQQPKRELLMTIINREDHVRTSKIIMTTEVPSIVIDVKDQTTIDINSLIDEFELLLRSIH